MQCPEWSISTFDQNISTALRFQTLVSYVEISPSVYINASTYAGQYN